MGALTIKYFYKLFKFLILIDYYIEKNFKKLFKTRYKLTGKCLQCGKCCEQIGVFVPRFSNNRFVLLIIAVFIEKVNEFKYSQYLPEEKVLIFTCNNFDDVNKKCLNYRFRPAICRNYPMLRYFDKPVLFEECGYRPKLT